MANLLADPAFFPGARVRVFNTRVYRDDVSTPLDVTLQPATVVSWYGRRSFDGYPNESLIDVQFDGERLVSCGHFTDFVEHLS